jgi:hypothetical protein
MTKQVHDIIARGDARIVEAPVRHQVEADRSFGLPTALYAAMVGCYLGFLAILALVFGNAALAIPLIIFVVAIVAGFGVPAIWTRLKGNVSSPLTMGEFDAKGIMTLTGRLSARDAMVQMLTLPALVLAWGVVMVVIAALVR